MDKKTVGQWRDRLDQDRIALADPFPGVWARLDQKKVPWIPAAVVAAAVLVVLGWGVGALPADNGWEPIVDDLWSTSGESTGRPVEAGWEIGGLEWNFFDPGDDQGI